MSNKFEYSERVRSTPVGGSIELRVKNFRKLKHQDMFENEPFELGGVQWRLLLFRLWELSEAGPRREKLMARVLPCTDIPLECKYKISFRNQLDPCGSHSETVEWHSDGAYATQLWAWLHSGCMEYRNIVEPESGFLSDGTLVVSAEIQNIGKRQDAPDILRGAEKEADMALCNVEFIGLPTILDRMDHKKTYGIASTTRNRMRVVHAACTLDALLNEVPCRVWLCDQSPNGKVFIRHCLNELPETITLREIAEDRGEEQLWALLFVEHGLSEAQPPVSDNTSVIFCKLYDPEAAALTFIGHVLVRGDRRCFNLFSEIANLAALSPGQKFDLYLEAGELNVREITNLFESVDGNGICSGSVIVIRPREQGEEQVSEEIVQNALCMIYVEGLGLSGDEEEVEDYGAEVEEEAQVTDEDDDENMCVVCLCRPKTAGFVHGTSMHRCVCEDCAKEIEQTPEPRCPMCRAEIQHTIYEMF